MALTLIQAPYKLTPVRNQIVWCFSSTNSNQSGFRYIYTIYDKNNNFIAKLPVAKEPKYGFGYVDISSIISDNLLYDINVLGVTSSIPNSIFEWKINVSESYLYKWDFLDNAFTPGNVLGFYSTVQPEFVVGDIIEVYQDTPFTFNEYNGQATITGITFSGGYWIIATNKQRQGDTPVEPGTIYYANRKKTLNVGPTYSGYYSFNGRKSHYDYIGYTASQYTIVSNPTASVDAKLLTDLPNNFYMTEDGDMWLNMFRGSEPVEILSNIKVYLSNSEGEYFSSYYNIWDSTYPGRGGQMALGPGNMAPLVSWSGTASLITPNTEWYEFYLSDGFQAVSKTYRVYIDRRCKIEDYEILFLDKMGSYVSYAFQLRSKETFTIERGQYNKALGDIKSNGWSYGSTDAGSTIYSINSMTELELNTNWMNDEMSVYFRQLLESAHTLLKVDGVYHPVIVQDNGGETIRQKNKQLIRKSIKVRFSNNEIGNI